MRDQNIFVTSCKKNSGNSFEIWYTTYWINLLQNPVDNFHLAWITSLHYFVKLKMLIAGMLPLNCWTKKLHSLSHLICDLDDSSRSVMPNLSTFSCNISPHTSMSSLDWLKMQNTFNLLDQYCGHTTKYKHCKHDTCHVERQINVENIASDTPDIAAYVWSWCAHSTISLLSASVLISIASLLSVSIFTSNEPPAYPQHNKHLNCNRIWICDIQDVIQFTPWNYKYYNCIFVCLV